MKKCIYKDIDGICKHDGNISELKLTFLLVKYTEESERQHIQAYLKHEI